MKVLSILLILFSFLSANICVDIDKSDFKDNEKKALEELYKYSIVDLKNFDDRVLSEKFLRTVLVSNNFKNGTLVIQNAIFNDMLYFSNISVGRSIFLHDCNFTNSVAFFNTNFNSSLSLSNSNFEKKVNLVNSNINFQFDLTGSSFREKLDMQTLKVGESLFIDNTTFKNIILKGAEINKQLSIENSNFDFINMYSLQINDRFSLENSNFNEVNMVYSKIDGVSYINENNGKINLDNSQINTFDIRQENNISLVGFSFKALSKKLMEKNGFKKIKNLLNNSLYYHSNYQEFANFYKRIGEDEKAKELLFLSHYRGLKHKCRELNDEFSLLLYQLYLIAFHLYL